MHQVETHRPICRALTVLFSNCGIRLSTLILLPAMATGPGGIRRICDQYWGADGAVEERPLHRHATSCDLQPGLGTLLDTHYLQSLL